MMMIFQNRNFLNGIRIVHVDLQQKTIELRFRKRIRAFKFDRVLGGKHGEESGERMGNAVNRKLALFHGLQQGSLGAWRHAVDLVGRQKVGEEGSAVEGEGDGSEVQ